MLLNANSLRRPSRSIRRPSRNGSIRGQDTRSHRKKTRIFRLVHSLSKDEGDDAGSGNENAMGPAQVASLLKTSTTACGAAWSKDFCEQVERWKEVEVEPDSSDGCDIDWAWTVLERSEGVGDS